MGFCHSPLPIPHSRPERALPLPIPHSLLPPLKGSAIPYSLMPTLLNQDGFKFFIYANEHEPKHVHVAKGEDYAKIELDTLRIVVTYMKSKDLKKALQIVEVNRELFEEKWDEWFRAR
jgi:hypothetical protein